MSPAATEPYGRSRLAGGLAVCVLFMGSTLLTPLYGLYRSAYDYSALASVLLYASYVLGNLAALLFLGRLSDLIGRKPVVLAGLGLAGAGALLFLAARSPAWLFAGRIASGCAVGLGAGAATAWITESLPLEKRRRAAGLMTVFNFIGLALGPLLGGVLVEYAPAPLRLPFGVYLAGVAAAALAAVAAPETLQERAQGPVSLKPRLGVPAGIRLAFVSPAATAFAAMALIGFYAALGPTMIARDLHVSNHALSGAAVAELFVVAAATLAVTGRMPAWPGMFAGLALTPVGLVALIAAERLASVPMLLVGTAMCGVAGALSYRGSLQVANGLAPADRRAEVVSAYFVCTFLGNAVPVIGVGALSQAAGPRVADLVFAAVVSVIAVAALALGLKFRAPDTPRRARQ